MRIKTGLVFFLAAFLLGSCDFIDELKNSWHIPFAKDFPEWFQWFIKLLYPSYLTNKEILITTILLFFSLGLVVAVVNSQRILNFFKEPPVQNEILLFLLIKPTFLLFPLTHIQHPGWAVGIWLILRLSFLVILLLIVFISLFYLVVILPYIIVTLIIILVISIFAA